MCGSTGPGECKYGEEQCNLGCMSWAGTQVATLYIQHVSFLFYMYIYIYIHILFQTLYVIEILHHIKTGVAQSLQDHQIIKTATSKGTRPTGRNPLLDESRYSQPNP